MRFAHFPTISSVLSNADDLRRQSRHVGGVPMENRPPMTRRDGASELPNLNEGCELPHAVQPRTPQARGRQSRCSITDLQLNSNDAA
jgi:hypothetical protein